MKVYKFGGASIKDAQGFNNVVGIIKQSLSMGDLLLVVVSALNKTTNNLEAVVNALWNKKDPDAALQLIMNEHSNICKELYLIDLVDKIASWISELRFVDKDNFESYDALYDDVVANGELLSSTILYELCNSLEMQAHWVDARKVIKTSSNYRAAEVDVEATRQRFNKYFSQNYALQITQGFVGSNEEGRTTTLGREGSDYTASLLANAAGVREVTVWKDVAGIYNADPKRFAEAVILRDLPYRQAAEMTYYGASVIHPRTLEPLIESGIKLKVKSFINPKLDGTTVGPGAEHSHTSLIMQFSQCVLISIATKEFAYITDWHLSHILQIASVCRTKTLLIQHSAMSLAFCVPTDINKSNNLIETLKKHYVVHFNDNLELFTIKNPTKGIEA